MLALTLAGLGLLIVPRALAACSGDLSCTIGLLSVIGAAICVPVVLWALWWSWRGVRDLATAILAGLWLVAALIPPAGLLMMVLRGWLGPAIAARSPWSRRS